MENQDHWNSFCQIDEVALGAAIKDFMLEKKDRFDYAKHRVKVTLVPGAVEIVSADTGEPLAV